jgi:hypothetical protein
MQLQQELHVQQCRENAVERAKMLRLTKLQRRVAEHKAAKLQQRLECVCSGKNSPDSATSMCCRHLAAALQLTACGRAAPGPCRGSRCNRYFAIA